MKFLDLFAGIGGFRLGMEQAGHECIGFCEIDKFARKSYKTIHNTEGEVEWHDITTVSNDDFRLLRGQVDVICGGFPCQTFSIAGKRKGFEDTRGTLFFEIARAAKEIEPRYLFLENVKGLLSHEGGQTFGTILSALDELGYDVEWQVCNSKNYGVPQNRERVFIIGHSRRFSRREVFPIGGNGPKTDSAAIKQIGNIHQGDRERKNPHTGRIYSADGIAPCLNTMGGGGLEPKIAVLGNVNPSKKGMNGQVYDTIGLASTISTNKGEGSKIAIPVLSPDRIEKRQNGRRFKENGETMFTLTAQDRHGVAIKEATKKGYAVATVGDSINLAVPRSKTRRERVGVGVGVANTPDTSCNQGVCDGSRIRKLTPRECWRLQGFPDWAFEKAATVNSNSQLYKQAGNSVTVNVICEISKKFKI